MDVEVEEKTEWTKIRAKLNQAYKYEKVWWEQAIALFDKRVTRKYFNPIQLIINSKTLNGEGFTIVTIQCALIEIFAAFKKGKIFNHNRTSTSPKYEYKESQKMFTSLLRTASIFRDNFWQLNNKSKIVIDKPYNSVDFYKYVRCGLMHEARTKENWHITATPLSIRIKTEKKFLVPEGEKTQPPPS